MGRCTALLVVAVVALGTCAASAASGGGGTQCTPASLTTTAPSGTPVNVGAAEIAGKMLSNDAKLLRHPPTKNNSMELAFAQKAFNQHNRIFAVAVSYNRQPRLLAYRVRDRLLLHTNRAADTEPYWSTLSAADGAIGVATWTPPFKDCDLNRGVWYQGYITSAADGLLVGVFVPVSLDQCRPELSEIFGGPDKCDKESTFCVPKFEHGLKRGGYRCLCKERFYFEGANHSWKGFQGDDVEISLIPPRCAECPEICDACDVDGRCLAHRDPLLRATVLCVQLACMALTVVIAIVVFKQRKCKTIASGMWTILETILLGILLLYSTVALRTLEPTTTRCLMEAWAHELGFIICYGSIVLKLYRHLVEFRTRKAHRWVVKDTDLLKYLLIMVSAVIVYMAAFTAMSFDFTPDDGTGIKSGLGGVLVWEEQSSKGLHHVACRPLWWDRVTQAGELGVLLFGAHLAYASYNAATPYKERAFLCACICIELCANCAWYVLRATLLLRAHPDADLLAHVARSQLTHTLVLALVFTPKLWFQHRQARAPLAQEFSCRLPVDAFKPGSGDNLGDSSGGVGPGSGGSSGAAATAAMCELTLAEMNPDDIRAELKRLYTQLEVLRNKTLRANNPHISKRRGGRKVAHRRFSLQALHASKQRGMSSKTRSALDNMEPTTEGEISRTPEDSVCSGEGPSVVELQ